MLTFLVGCHSFQAKPPEKIVKFEPPASPLPSKKSLRVSQFVFHHDFELRANLPLFTELDQLRERVHRELQLPVSNALVHVYLFEDKDRYERYMESRYPGLPKRRAFFVAQPRGVDGGEELLVFTWWGDKVQQDLRHELTHALLHSVLKGVPLWLDEGLAEYYETPPAWQNINHPHLEDFRRAPITPNLGRLEGLAEVKQMGAAEYREAWAWVHLMLHSTPEARQVLVDYLRELRSTAKSAPLAGKLADALNDPERAVSEHVRSLLARAPALAPSNP